MQEAEVVELCPESQSSHDKEVGYPHWRRLSMEVGREVVQKCLLLYFAGLDEVLVVDRNLLILGLKDLSYAVSYASLLEREGRK